MFDALRHMALEAGHAPEPSVYALHRSFLDSIKMWGRVHELTMIMEFKFRQLKLPALFFDGLISDLMMAGGLFARQKLSFIPERIKGVGKVRELYETGDAHPPAEVES
jgi:heterodisulfide reductase subunit C